MAFLIDALVALLYGLWLLILPEMHATLFGFPYEEFAHRYIGALFLAFGVGSVLAYRASSWEIVEIVVIMNFIFLGVGVSVMLYSIAFAIWPITGFTQVGISSFLLLLFIYAYFEAKMKT
jgi:hypothetical protein